MLNRKSLPLAVLMTALELAALSLAFPARAQTPTPPTASINTEAYDLSSEAGVDKLKAVVRRKAKQLCIEDRGADGKSLIAQRACYQAAVTKGFDRIDAIRQHRTEKDTAAQSSYVTR